MTVFLIFSCYSHELFMILLQLSRSLLLILDWLSWGYLDQGRATGWGICWICCFLQFKGYSSGWLVAWGHTPTDSCVDDQIISWLSVWSSVHLDLLNNHTLGRLPSFNLGKVSLGYLVVIHREFNLFKISYLQMRLLRWLLMVVLDVIKHCEVLPSSFLSLVGQLWLISAAARSNLAIVWMPLMIGIKRSRRTWDTSSDTRAC